MARERRTTQDDVMRVLKSRNREVNPVLTPSDVANGMEASRPTVSNRLHELEEAGRVKYREVGQSTLWWPADEEMREEVEEVDDTEEVREALDRVTETVRQYTEYSVTGLTFAALGFSLVFLFDGVTGVTTPQSVLVAVLLLQVLFSLSTFVLLVTYWILESRIGDALKETRSAAGRDTAEADDTPDTTTTTE